MAKAAEIRLFIVRALSLGKASDLSPESPPSSFCCLDQDLVSEPEDETEETDTGPPAQPRVPCSTLQLRPGDLTNSVSGWTPLLLCCPAPETPAFYPGACCAVRLLLSQIWRIAKHLPLYGKWTAVLPSTPSSSPFFPSSYSEQNGQAMPPCICIIVKKQRGRVFYTVMYFMLRIFCLVWKNVFIILS